MMPVEFAGAISSDVPNVCPGIILAMIHPVLVQSVFKD
jgi:hypothetical protein